MADPFPNRDDFLVTPEIRSAREAVRMLAVAVERGQSFPLLVIHGPPGCGKSRLADDLARRLGRRKSRIIQRFAATDFGRSPDKSEGARTNGAGGNPRSRSGADLVIVDNVQFLPSESADRLAHLLDQRRRRGGATLLTAGKAPNELPIRRRLWDRLVGGLVVGIPSLAPESRRKLLQRMVRRANIRIAAEIEKWVARNPGEFRSLVGIVNTLTTLAQGRRGAVSYKRFLTAMGETKKPAVPPGIADIAALTAADHRVTLGLIRGVSRRRGVVQARQEAMAVARAVGHSFPQIGRYFGNRDHTTVLHACRKIEDLCKTDPRIAQSLNDRLRKLGREPVWKT